MKLKLRLRRRAGDEKSSGAIKKLLIFLIVMSLFGTLVTYLHARALISYGPKDQEVLAPNEMGIGSMLFGRQIPKPTGISDPSKYELPYQHVTIGGSNTRIYTEEEKRQQRRRQRSKRRKLSKADPDQVYALESWFIPELHPAGLAVLFHDYGQCKADLIEVAAEFHDLHFSVLMVDLRASGETEGREATFGYRESRDVTQALLKANDFTPAGGIKVVYAIGTGAAAVLKAASEKKIQADAIILEGVFDTLRHFVDRRIKITGMAPVLIGWLTTAWIRYSENFKGEHHDPVQYAKRVKIPTLILHGDRDKQGSKAEADAVAQALGGRAVVIKGGGRPIPNLKSDEWFDVVSAFLNKVPRPTFEAPEADEIHEPLDVPGEPVAPKSTAANQPTGTR